MQVLIKKFGPDWCKKNVIPTLTENQKHASYVMRISTMYSFQYVALAYNKGDVEKTLVPFFKNGIQDPVVNVRFVTINVLK